MNTKLVDQMAQHISDKFGTTPTMSMTLGPHYVRLFTCAGRFVVIQTLGALAAYDAELLPVSANRQAAFAQEFPGYALWTMCKELQDDSTAYAPEDDDE